MPRRKRGHEDEGFHQLGSAAKARQVTVLLNSNRGRPNKLRRFSTKEDSDDSFASNNERSNRAVKRRIEVDEDLDENSLDADSESEDLRHDPPSNDSDEEDSSGSFCAIGNWGEDDESQASSSSSSLGLEVEKPLL